MATKVYDEIEIELSDGTVINVKPLAIKQLRKFMVVIKKLDDSSIENEDDAMEIFIEACMICLEKTNPDLSSDIEKFEEVIEIPTMMKILEVAGGLKTADPNLLGAVMGGTT